MPAPITGLEQKIRAFEAPLANQLAADHVVALDGLVGGPARMAPPVFTGEAIKNMQPIVPDPVSGAPQVPVVTLVNGVATTGRADLKTMVSGQEGFYLGPKSSPPIADNFGRPLKPGHLYFNLNDETLYIWSSAGAWIISAASLPSAIRVYYYTMSVAGTLLPPNGPNTADGLGNVLAFDVSSGQAAVSGVSVYVNGVFLMNGVDYTVHEGGAAGDYITLAEEMCAGSVAVVQVFAAGTTQSFANSVQLNTSSWVFDGRSTFPLLDPGGIPVVPNSANNCMISQNSDILQPNVEFTVSGDQITFTSAPRPDDNVWGVVGLPITGAQGEFGSRVTVFQHGGRGDGVTDDSDALEAAINQVNLNKATLDLAGGTWRITRQMPTLFYPRVDGGGSGEIYVDYDMALGSVIACAPVLGEQYPVTAVAVVDYDFEGAFSALSKVTRLTITLTTGQPMPQRGQIAKITSSVQLVGTETGDTAGQMLAIVATDDTNHYVYMTGVLRDTYTSGGPWLQILGSEQVFLRNFGIRANWDRLVAENWYGTFILIIGAMFPKLADIWIRDGAQGIVLAGTWMAGTRGLRINRMRNATASTTLHVPGYGVVDAGSYMSVHTDLSGSDCRHVYTTISPDNASWPRVAWGRTFYPLINGGEASSCSAAAYDTHSDCVHAVFHNLIVHGSYYGQNSAGAGIQFRGVRGKAINCVVHDTQVGYEIYKQFAGEEGWHHLEGCFYFGSGEAIRIDHDPTLAVGSDATQTANLGDFYCETTNSLMINSWDGVVCLLGSVRCIQKGDFSTGNAPRAWEMRRNSIVASRGGLLHYDFSLITGSLLPRVFSLKENGAGTAGPTDIKVIAGSVAWQAVVSENETTPVTVAVMQINADVDKAPNAASGGFSQNGASNLLPAGVLQLIMTTNQGRVPTTRTSGFTVNASMNRSLIICNGTFTVTVPAATILGPDFWLELLCGSGTITVDGPGGTNPTIAANSAMRIVSAGGTVFSRALAQGLLS
jgi:hypothetical protein